VTAAALHLAVERPFMKWRDRTLQRRALVPEGRPIKRAS
jgi:peptidoglycan/LPS O-acetylase OafA/YrhL